MVVSLQDEIAHFQVIDSERATTVVDERMVYEQLAYHQISHENVSGALTALFDAAGLIGAPSALRAVYPYRPSMVTGIQQPVYEAEFDASFTNDSASDTASDPSEFEDGDQLQMRRQSEVARWKRSKMELMKMEAFVAAQTNSDQSGGQYPGLTFPALPTVDLTAVPRTLRYAYGDQLEEVRSSFPFHPCVYCCARARSPCTLAALF
jgi:hypothetical protein